MAVLLLAAAAAIASFGLKDDLSKAEAGVVFGMKINRDGTPSRGLSSRLDRAEELYRLGLIELVVVSGGMGPAGYVEADIMRSYLLARGVPGEKLISDRESKTSYETARFAARLSRDRGWRRMVVITQYFHMLRCVYALKRAGAHGLSRARARLFLPGDIFSIPREMAALLYYSLRKYR